MWVLKLRSEHEMKRTQCRARAEFEKECLLKHEMPQRNFKLIASDHSSKLSRMVAPEFTQVNRKKRKAKQT